MESILLGIIANFLTDFGKFSLRKIIGNINIQNQLELAYLNALKKWTINKDIRNKEEIWTNSRINQLIENSTKQEIPLNIDPGIRELLKLFQEEVLYQDEAWKYIQDLKFRSQLESINNIDNQLKLLVESAKNETLSTNQLIEHVELLSKTSLFQLNKISLQNDEIIELINKNSKIIPVDEGIRNWIEIVKYEERKITIDILNGKTFYDVKNNSLSNLFYQFIYNDTWVFRISGIISKIKNYDLPDASYQLKSLLNSLSHVRLDQKYSNIQYEILELFSELKPFSLINKESNLTENKGNKSLHVFRNLNSEISILHSLVTKPKFGKCFLLSGSAGSGKTHYISKCLEDQSLLKIILSEYNSDISLEDRLIQKVRDLCRQPLNGFDEMANLFNNEVSAKKIFIVIENIEKFQTNFFNQIFNLIDKTTVCQNVFWIITINYNFFDKVLEFENSFNKYIPNYKYPYILDKHLYEISGWINLDYINKVEQIGEKIIIQNALVDLPDERVNNFKNNLNKSKKSIEPFLAWIICETWNYGNENEIHDLIYLEIIAKLEESFRLRYDKSLSTFNTIQELLDYVSVLIIADQIVEINSVYLKNEVQKLAKNESILEEATHIINSLSNLLLLGLFRKNFIDLRNINLLYLNILPYWQYLIARSIVQINDFESEIEILKNFKNPSNESFKSFAENIGAFILLILDKEQQLYDGNMFFNRLKSILLNNIFPKSSFWFACLKMSMRSQKRIVLLIKELEIIPFDNKHDLFSYIQCIGFLKANNYRLHERIIDLIKYLNQISEHNLNTAVLVALKNIINQTTDLVTLFDSIQYLHGIEVLEIHDQLSSYIIDHSFKLTRDEHEVSVFLKNYLRENCDNSKPLITKMDDGRKTWKRYYVREWLIYHFCHHIADYLNERSYDFFKEIGFYRSKKGEFNYPIFIELERESNIAIGGLYQEAFLDQDNFLEFINRLYNSSDFIDKVNCFHIIRHTVPTHGSNKIKIDREFKPILKKIYNDYQLRHIRERFHEIFEYNKINNNMR